MSSSIEPLAPLIRDQSVSPDLVIAKCLERPADAREALREVINNLGQSAEMVALRVGRLMETLSPSPLSEALAVLEKGLVLAYGLSWMLLRQTDRDSTAGARLEAALSSLCGPDPSQWKSNSAIVVVCQAIGRCGAPALIPRLEDLLQKSQTRLKESLALNTGLSAHLCEEVLPLPGAVAAALLAISERHGLDNPADRARWREICLELALASGKADTRKLCYVPLPFLFCGARREAAAILIPFLEAVKWSGLAGFGLGLQLVRAAENGIRLEVDASAPGLPELIDEAEQRLRKPYNDPAPFLYELLSALAPERALTWASDVLTRGPLRPEGLELVLREARRNRSLHSTAAIRMEFALGALHDRWPAHRFLTEWATLDNEMREEGLEPKKGLTWRAPPPDPNPRGPLEELNQHLCIVFECCQRAENAPTTEAARAALQRLDTLPNSYLVRHARYRCLLPLLGNPVDYVGEAASSAMATLAEESDARLLHRVDEMADFLCSGGSAGYVLPLLRNPLVRKEPKFANHLINSLPKRLFPEAAQVVQDLRAAFAPQVKQPYDDFSSVVKVCDWALDFLEPKPSVRALAEKYAAGGPLTRAQFLWLLEAADGGEVPAPVLERLLTELVTKEHYILREEELRPIMGQRVAEFNVQRLEDPLTPSEQIAGVGHLLSLEVERQPPLALALVLRRLPAAIDAALQHPGEEYGDDIIRGYAETPQEKEAVALSRAALQLAKRPWPWDEWRCLLQSLAGLKGITLSAVRIGTVEGLSFDIASSDLLARLRTTAASLGLSEETDARQDELAVWLERARERTKGTLA